MELGFFPFSLIVLEFSRGRGLIKWYLCLYIYINKEMSGFLHICQFFFPY